MKPACDVSILADLRPPVNPLLEVIMNAGADAVCCKPFVVDQLLATIERLLSPKGARQGGWGPVAPGHRNPQP